jgi:hypothetical protein
VRPTVRNSTLRLLAFLPGLLSSGATLAPPFVGTWAQARNNKLWKDGTWDASGALSAARRKCSRRDMREKLEAVSRASSPTAGGNIGRFGESHEDGRA